MTGISQPVDADAWEGEGLDLPINEIRKLSNINPLLSVLHIAWEWFLIAGAIGLSQYFSNPFVTLLSIMCLGARQHALLILMHDASHYRLFKNKVLNDWICEIFLAWPVFVTVRAFRSEHFLHHRFVNTPKDPDWIRKKGNEQWDFPMSRKNLNLMILKDILGLNSYLLIKDIVDLSKNPESSEKKPTGTNSEKLSDKKYSIARGVFYSSVAALVVYHQVFWLFIFYWIIPMLSWLKAITRLRSIAEHCAIKKNTYVQTRNTLASFWEGIFLAPKSIGLHLDHHLYPSVPFYRLPKLHQLLLTNRTYKERAHVTAGYGAVLEECVEERDFRHRLG